MPQPIHIALLSGVFAVIAFVLAFAQRLGEWKSKAWARVLGALAILLIACWVYLALLWIFKLDIHALFAEQPPVFWVIMGTLSAMGTAVASPIWLHLPTSNMSKKIGQPKSDGDIIALKEMTERWANERAGSASREQIIIERDNTIEQLRRRLTEADGKFTKRPEHTLDIHSAEWIPKEHGKPRPVKRFLQQHVKETLVDSINLRLINKHLGGEVEEDTHKILKVSYSYGSDGPYEIVKDEYQWLVLPEPRLSTLPAKMPHIHGSFSNVKLLSHGVITKNEGQRWMKCGFSVSVSLNSSRAVGIHDIQLRTHRHSPPCLPLSAGAPPQVSKLDGGSSHSFTAWPQIEYLYDGTNVLPESLDMIVVDELEGEHVIFLKSGEALPNLPSDPASAEAV